MLASTKKMDTFSSCSGIEKKATITPSWDSPQTDKSPLIKKDDNSKNTKFPVKSQNRETLLILLQQQKFAHFEQLANSRNNFQDFTHFYPDPFNGTLLDIACKFKGNSRVVKFLLNKSAVNPNILNKITGKAPIHEVLQHGDRKMLKVLTKHQNFDSANITDRDGNTPLHVAVVQNKVGSTQILLKNCQKCRSPIDINMSSPLNPSPLHLALLLGNVQVAEVLIKRSGIDLDFQKDSQGRTCRQVIQQEYSDLEVKLLSQFVFMPLTPLVLCEVM